MNALNVNLIQIYVSTVEKPETPIEEFYEQVPEVLHSLKGHKITIILGDFNAKGGQELMFCKVEMLTKKIIFYSPTSFKLLHMEIAPKRW